MVPEVGIPSIDSDLNFVGGRKWTGNDTEIFSRKIILENNSLETE